MASGQLQKLEGDVHIKASAEKFHDFLCRRTHLLGTIFPDKVQSVQIHEGEWGTEGSIISWNCVLEGKACAAKELVESIDAESNKVTFKVLEGDVLEHYKSFRFVIHATPVKEGSVVHITMEYEKLNDQIPDPHFLMLADIEMSRAIDAYLMHGIDISN